MIPEKPADLTPEWMTEVLGPTVTSIRIEDRGPLQEQGVGVPVSAQRASRQTGTVELKRAARARRGVDDGLQIANRIAPPSCLDQEETIFETGTAEGNLLGDGRQHDFPHHGIFFHYT